MNDDGSTSKRSISTSSPPPPSVKRVKSEHHDPKLAYSSPPPLPLSAAQGVERIALVNVNRLSAEHLHRLVNERTNTLRAQGRHVAGLPVVLNDGIILNWVLHRSGDAVESHEFDNVRLVHRNVSWFEKHKNDRPCLSLVSTGGSSGTGAANAIVIDSDEDLGKVSKSFSCPGTSRDRQFSNASFNQETNFAHSNIEPLSSIENNSLAAPHHSPLPLARELPSENISDSDMSMSSDSPPSRALSRGEVLAATLSRLSSDYSDMTTSDCEINEINTELEDADDVDDTKISAGQAKSPSFQSLQSIRQLLTKTKRRGNPEGDVLPGGTVITPKGSQKQKRNEFLEETPAIMSIEGDDGSSRQASDPQLKRVPLPKTEHGRARRLLLPDSADLPLVAVTMRGDCHFIERKKKFRITGYSLPNPGVFRHVGDACMVGNTAVLGYDKGTHQISLLSVAGKPQMIDVAWSPHSSEPRYQDTQKRGVSHLAAVHADGGHIKFLTGGYDGTIHQWTASAEGLNEPRSRKVASHGACIMALAYCDRDRSVIASAQRRLHITDLNRSTTITHPFSNVIHQIHIHPQAAYMTLLEVQHLDRQIQLYDSRKGNFDGEPCLSFGYRDPNGKFPGKHMRGSVHLVHFARGSEDGCVMLWDFRNSKRAMVERRFRQVEKVVHTIFADRDIATFGQGVVTFFEDYLVQ